MAGAAAQPLPWLAVGDAVPWSSAGEASWPACAALLKDDRFSSGAVARGSTGLHWDAPRLDNEEGRCLLQVTLCLVMQWQVPSELCEQCRCVKAWCVSGLACSLSLKKLFWKNDPQVDFCCFLLPVDLTPRRLFQGMVRFLGGGSKSTGSLGYSELCLSFLHLLCCRQSPTG